MTVPARGSRRLVLRAQLHIFDYAILALAGVSLAVFLLDRTGALPGEEVRILRYVDVTLVLLYGAAFATKWVLADDPLRWLRRNAVYAIGILPLTIPFLVAERYFILVQMIVVMLRVGAALDRAFGQRVLEGIFARYRAMVVEELSAPLLMRLAIVLEEAVLSRDYASAVGRRLDERRDLVEAAVQRAIAASPKLVRISKFGPVREFVDDTTDELVDAAHAALTGPEVNTLIREGLQEAFAELKQGIADRKWQGKGVGVKEVAAGVVGGRTG
jgi:hypothetical protein